MNQSLVSELVQRLVRAHSPVVQSLSGPGGGVDRERHWAAAAGTMRARCRRRRHRRRHRRRRAVGWLASCPGTTWSGLERRPLLFYRRRLAPAIQSVPSGVVRPRIRHPRGGAGEGRRRQGGAGRGCQLALLSPALGYLCWLAR